MPGEVDPSGAQVGEGAEGLQTAVVGGLAEDAGGRVCVGVGGEDVGTGAADSAF